MNGKCDVPGCEQPTYMGWRPLSESRGWQICKTHWLRHKNQNDSCDLFEAFGLRRPMLIDKAGAGFFAAGRKRQPEKNKGPAKPMRPEPEKRSDGRGGRQAPGRCRACGLSQRCDNSNPNRNWFNGFGGLEFRFRRLSGDADMINC